MQPLEASYQQLLLYALMLVRVGVLFVSAPVLGNARIPGQVKAGATLVIALLLTLSMKGFGEGAPALPGNLFELTGAVLGEAFVGLLVGYSAYLLFTAIQMAGQVIDIQIGFGLVNVIDPAGGQQVSILGQFYYLIAMLFFLAVDGHHLLLRALGDSFGLIPPGRLFWFDQAAQAGPLLSQFVTKLFVIAFQVAAPSIAVLFLTNLAMGLVSRTMPAMNVFIVGLPLNVVVGLGITILSLKLLGTVLGSVVSQIGVSSARLIAALGAGG